MMAIVEFAVFFTPFLVLVLVVWRADRGKDPGNVFASRASERDRLRRRDGGDSGPFLWVSGDGASAGGSGDGGGGGGGGD
jgi:hypothetical protein